MKVLDLFSGIGGFSLGLERAGMQTVAFCEIEEYPRKVLKKHWPDVPIYDDIRELTGDRLKQDGITADLICGGYPCQPFSTAGKRQGEGDDRHLWPEMYRLIKTLRPRWVIAENVAGHISMGLDAVLSDLEAEDYTWWPFIIPACAVDAKHRRDRIWIVGNAKHNGSLAGQKQGSIGSAICNNKKGAHETSQSEGASKAGNVANTQNMQRNGKPNNPAKSKRQVPELGISSGAEDMADPSGAGLPEPTCTGFRGIQGQAESLQGSELSGGNAEVWRGWPTEPPVGRVANGIPRRVERLRGLGNAVVPQIPEIIGRAIMEIESNAINHQ